LLLLPLASACGGSDEAGGAERERAIAAFYPIAFAVERVGGGELDVSNLTPPGTEPHDLELTGRAVERVRSADYIFYLGQGFQPALEDAAAQSQGRAVDLLLALRLHEAAAAEEDEEHAGEESARDPHVWLDPMRFARLVERIGEELGRPAEARKLAGKLRSLDREFREGLADCRRRELVTSHAAFGYLAERYGLTQIPITGLSPEVEPSPRRLEAVVKRVEAHRATTIFFETLVSPRLAETVARETGAKTAVLNPIEGLTEEQIDAGEDYFSVMRENLEAVSAALGCR